MVGLLGAWPVGPFIACLGELGRIRLLVEGLGWWLFVAGGAVHLESRGGPHFEKAEDRCAQVGVVEDTGGK